MSSCLLYTSDVYKRQGPILDIKPFVVRKAAIITTGNEVYHGRIQDAFTPVSYTHLDVYKRQNVYCRDYNDK